MGKEKSQWHRIEKSKVEGWGSTDIELMNTSFKIEDTHFTFEAPGHKDGSFTIGEVQISLPAGWKISVCKVTPPDIALKFNPEMRYKDVEITGASVTQVSKNSLDAEDWLK